MPKRQIFVACPIGLEGSPERRRSDQLLEFIVEPVAHELDYSVRRGDQIGEPGRITHQIERALAEADVVLADLTGLNPNVMYEVGVRQAFEQPLILMADRETTLPFDLKDFRTIYYDLTLPGARQAINELKDHLSASDRSTDTEGGGTGLDLTRVRETGGVFWTTVSDCQIRVVEGRIEDYPVRPGVAIALPCNEYFDDRCVEDEKSALGAYVNRVFQGEVEAFKSLMKSESVKKLGPGVERQKTDEVRATSFGPGQCLLLLEPLGHPGPVALISTTTQRDGQGLAGRLSYLFDGMRRLVRRLANARLNEVVMPLLASGHGGIHPPLAFVGLLLAVAEAARYGEGAQRLKRVTIVVFKRNAESAAEVDRIIVRRALALIGSRQ